MMKSGVCGCGSRVRVDVYDPIRVRKLREWAESDALFLRKLSMTKEDEEDHKSDKFSPPPPPLGFVSRSVSEPCRQSLDERFACRQRYLRSYTFGKDPEDKVTIIGKSKKYWLKLKKLNDMNTGDKGEEATCNSLLKGGFKFLFLCIAQVDIHKS
ncbi:hypothetical protein Patl1_28844 [Pistacia atlantica]|uniref:Uncharacterized protein n=1 Tax=Pistacia atlantica TaxID=434234 RepID=A0ACC1BG65_9ROSI|nr:hypothetical protein Patl1_28844 [Pistacia atlantica]